MLVRRGAIQRRTSTKLAGGWKPRTMVESIEKRDWGTGETNQTLRRASKKEH